MFILALLFLALVFFIILAKGADLLVGNLRALTDKTKIHPVLLGTILGLLTTMPELMVGLNALRQDVPAVSLGNIWGGVVVISALILGLSIVLQREIKTDGHLLVVLPSFVFILLSLFLGLKGSFHYYDGLLLFAFYLILIYFDYLSGSRYQKDKSAEAAVLTAELAPKTLQRMENHWLYWRRELSVETWWAVIGLFMLSISSYALMELTGMAMEIFSLPPFLVGVLVFSIGTNLPEIMVMFRALKTKNGDLSFGHLIGSAVSNILVLALLSIMMPIVVVQSWTYYILIIFIALILSAIAIFYVSKKKFQRWEGIVLLGLYLLFVIYQLL